MAVLIARLKTVTLGERMTLARRASGRVAAALLLEVDGGDGKTAKTKTIQSKTIQSKTGPREPRVMQTALDNPRLTEALVIQSVLRAGASAALVHAVARHEKWSRRKEIRAALCGPSISRWLALWSSAGNSSRVCCKNCWPVRGCREDQRSIAAREHFCNLTSDLRLSLFHPIRDKHIRLMLCLAVAMGDPHQLLSVGAEHREASKRRNR